jgi:hypothetical protein
MIKMFSCEAEEGEKKLSREFDINKVVYHRFVSLTCDSKASERFVQNENIIFWNINLSFYLSIIFRVYLLLYKNSKNIIVIYFSYEFA